MGKNKELRGTAKAASPYQTALLDIDVYFRKYTWIVIPVLTLVYFLFSRVSTGFYQDDELGHFINMKDFWIDPGQIISNWAKPGWKIILVLPSLLGYDFVLFFNSLISAVTVFVTMRLAFKLNLKNSSVIAVFLGLQPVFFQLAFRSYAEIYTGLIFILICYTFYTERYNISMLLFGYLFLLRQETAPIALIVAIYLVIKKKKYLPVLFVIVFPLILQIAGMIKNNGDIMWMLKDIGNLQSMDFNKGTDRGFFFYFTNYIFIIGPVTIGFFLLGYFSFLYKDTVKNHFFDKHAILYITFTLYFLIQCALVMQGTNAGLLRYMLPASPMAAIFAGIGLNNILNPKDRNLHLTILLIISVLSLLLMSKDNNNWVMTDQSEFLKFGILTLLTLVYVFNIYMNKKGGSNVLLLIFIFVLSILYIYQKVEPLKESVENAKVREISDWYNHSEYKDNNLIYSHSNLTFYDYLSGFYKKDRSNMTVQSLKDAPVGTICIWDSHYSYNPKYEARNTQLEFFKDNPNFKLRKEFYSPDRKTFYAAVFEKVANNP
ncbi:hypothetical protein BH10BAC5_BH10BAC5_26340 [soil metagenome]